MREASVDHFPPAPAALSHRAPGQPSKLGALCALVLLLTAAAALQLVTARADLLSGSAQVEAAAAVLRDPLQLRSPVARTSLREQLLMARGQFSLAQRDLALWAPLLPHLGWVPVWGPQLSAAVPAADVSYRTADAALSLMSGLVPVLGAMEDRKPAGGRLARLTEALANARPLYARARDDMDRAATDERGLPARLGSRRLDSALRRLRRDVPRLRVVASWLAVAPDLLGARHPAHYLFVWQNPAELRATGGFLGASDFVTVSAGRISHHFFGHALPHEITWPAMPLPEEVYTPESTWLFEDSNWSPDFPLSARFERWFYGEDTGLWADGVIDFLDTATPDLLRATGPVYLPRYRLWVSADTVTAQAQHFVNGVNGYLNTGPDNSSAADRVRKQFFYAVLQALLARTEHLPLSGLPALASAVQSMIVKRELLAYDRSPAVQALVGSAGAGGRLSPGPADYLYVVDDNRSYNKLNPFVREDATLAVTVTQTRWLDETLTLDYHVNPSPANLEGGGPNWGLWGTKHDYQDFVRVYVPAGTRLVRMAGLDGWAPQPAYGGMQLAGRLLLREGQSRTVVIRYRVPPNVFAAAGPDRYRLHIQHQPGADLHHLQLVVRGGRGVSLGGGRRVRTLQIPLSTDAWVAIRVGGGSPRPVVLPLPPPFPDPYIPFLNLRDPRHPL